MDDAEAFGLIADRIGFQIRRIDVEWRAVLAEQLGVYGLTPSRATALIYVGLHEGCDQMSLGRALGINRASTMTVVNELAALDCVERRLGQDRRSNALHLTATGADLCRVVEEVTANHDRMALAMLTDAEQEELRHLLAKLRSGASDVTSEERDGRIRRIK